jgi:hypothetical protein
MPDPTQLAVLAALRGVKYDWRAGVFVEVSRMKNMYFVVSRNVFVAFLVAASLAVIVGCATQPASTAVASTDTGRLVITRNFSLGASPAVLWDSGVKVAMIDYNRTYDAPIAAGPHVFTLTRIPPGLSDISPETRLVVEKGQTYKFVAGMDGQRVMLLQ